MSTLTPLRTGTSNSSINSALQANPGDRVSADKSEIAPVVAILSRQLPLPQAQQLAGQTSMVRVLKSSPDGRAELDLNGQKIPVQLGQGRMLTAGELITVNFALGDKLLEASGDKSAAGKTNKTSSTKTENLSEKTPGFLSTAEDDNSDPSAMTKFSSGARLLGFLAQLNPQEKPSVSAPNLKLPDNVLSQAAAQTTDDLPTSTLAANAQPNTTTDKTKQQALNNKSNVVLEKLNPQDKQDFSTLLAKQVSNAVDKSGLFYESHLQQWALGQRSSEELAKEPQAKFTPEQIIKDNGLNEAALNQSAKLVNAQLATLDHSRIALHLNGLMGEPIHIEIEPDHDQNHQAQTQNGEPPPWTAHLKLDMAHLGVLHVRLRMVGSQCDVQIQGSQASKKAIDPHWNTFKDAMDLHGLQLVHGQVTTDGSKNAQ